MGKAGQCSLRYAIRVQCPGREAEHPPQTDVTDWTQLEAAFNAAVDTFGRLDIVCPGAAISDPPKYNFWSLKSGGDTAATSTYKTLEINITHPIRCTQLAIDYFMRQKLEHGTVLHMTSVAAQTPSAVVPLYHTSKAAISHFVRSMAPLEQIYNIRINAVAPANVKTSIWIDAGRAGYLDEEKGDEWITPERLADVMMDMLTGRKYIGGSIWEVGVDVLRKVELINDPGPDLTARGFTHANVGLAQTQLREMLEENFGK